MTVQVKKSWQLAQQHGLWWAYEGDLPPPEAGIERVLAADVDLAAAMLRNGWCKPAQAEAIIKNPVLLRKFRRMAKRAKRERD